MSQSSNASSSDVQNPGAPLLIGGHPRSGTTLLFDLCNSHPAISLTREFRCFSRLGRSYLAHMRVLRKDWYRSSILERKSKNAPLDRRLASGAFLLRYLIALLPSIRGPIGALQVERALRRLFPGSDVVGDKYPAYVFQLPALVHHDLKLVIVQRDARDVVSSYLARVRTGWKDKALARRFNTAERVAQNWLRAEAVTEIHANEIFVVRYENLVRSPHVELDRLASWLGVDRVGFDAGIIRADSLGKHQHGLTRQELHDVMRVAGTSLERLGYV